MQQNGPQDQHPQQPIHIPFQTTTLSHSSLLSQSSHPLVLANPSILQFIATHPQLPGLVAAKPGLMHDLKFLEKVIKIMGQKAEPTAISASQPLTKQVQSSPAHTSMLNDIQAALRTPLDHALSQPQQRTESYYDSSMAQFVKAPPTPYIQYTSTQSIPTHTSPNYNQQAYMQQQISHQQQYALNTLKQAQQRQAVLELQQQQQQHQLLRHQNHASMYAAFNQGAVKSSPQRAQQPAMQQQQFFVTQTNVSASHLQSSQSLLPTLPSPHDPLLPYPFTPIPAEEVQTLFEARETAWCQSLDTHRNHYTQQVSEYNTLLAHRHIQNTAALNAQRLPDTYQLTRSTCRFKLNEAQMIHAPTMQESLAPIRLDFEVDGEKVKDTFMWNAYDTLIDPQTFAEGLLDDFRITPDVQREMLPMIVRAIREQVADFIEFGGREMNTTESGQGNLEYCFENSQQRELRVVIKVNVTIGTISLNDQFEWDLDCTSNNPESFAKLLCQDLSLPREFVSAVSHQIREQIHAACKTLIQHEYPITDLYYHQPVFDIPELTACFLPQIFSTSSDEGLVSIRKDVQEKFKFGPVVTELSLDELERLERDRDRDSRRKRRTTQRGRSNVSITERDAFKSTPTPLPISTPYVDQLDNALDPLIVEKVPIYSYVDGEMRLSMLEPMIGDANSDSQTAVSTNTIRHNHSHVDWKCANCDIDASLTEFLHDGPTGERSLCDQCGLYQLKNDQARPVTYIEPIPPFKDPKPLNKPFPSWLQRLQDSVSTRYADGSFQIVYKKEWKVQCDECMGKLYNVGPAESLDNYEAHLKTKTHRAK